MYRNFNRGEVGTGQNVFRKPRKAAGEPHTSAKPVKEVDWEAIGATLLGILRQYPDEYDAVEDEMEKLEDKPRHDRVLEGQG